MIDLIIALKQDNNWKLIQKIKKIQELWQGSIKRITTCTHSISQHPLHSYGKLTHCSKEYINLIICVRLRVYSWMLNRTKGREKKSKKRRDWVRNYWLCGRQKCFPHVAPILFFSISISIFKSWFICNSIRSLM